MNKDTTDGYIGDYIFYNFVEIRNPLLPRNFSFEKKIINTSKIDYILQNYASAYSENVNIQYPDQFFDFFTYLQKNLENFSSNKQINITKDLLSFDINAPFLYCYCEMQSISLEDAINTLNPELESFEKKMSEMTKDQYCNLKKKKDECEGKILEISKQNYVNHEKKDKLTNQIKFIDHEIIIPELANKKREYYRLDVVADFFINESESFSQAIIHYSPKFKFLLPSFLYSSYYQFNTLRYYFNPFYHYAPLFNLFYLQHRPKAIVILTDSIEIAKKNQFFADKARCTNIIWISWYGEQSSIEHVDWEPLKGRTIYYLLKEHSGIYREQICQIALLVRNKLFSLGNLFIKYIFLLENPYADYLPSQLNSITLILNHKTFQDFIDGKLDYSLHNSVSACSLIPQRSVYETGKIKTVFTPFIYSRSVAIIYGPYSAKTWIAINIALAIKYGDKMWEGCEARKSGNVLYVHGGAESNFLTERKQLLETQYKKTENTGNVFFYCPAEDKRSLMLNDLDLISYKLSEFTDNHPDLIILDSLPYLEKIKNKKGIKVELNCKLREWKSLNYAILIINDMSNKNWPGYRQWKKDLSIDAEVEIKKRDPICAEGIAASVSLRSGSRDRNSTKFQHVELDPTAKIPRWEIITTARTKEENKKRINKLLIEYELTDQKIAQGLNLSLDQVKKFKQELREEYKEFILNDNKNGVPESKISKKYGIAPQIVSSILRKRKNKNPYS